MCSGMASQQRSFKDVLAFFQLCGKLKHLKRTGWVHHHVADPETVSGHMYRMAMMAFLFGKSAESNISCEKCIKMSLVHDLAECIVGDITPSCGVSKEEKYKREEAAMKHIQDLLPEEAGKEMYDLWQEYESGSTPEAEIVKDLDKFDMVCQAFEYEQAENRPGELQQFFDSTRGVFRHEKVKEWVAELEALRNQSSSSSSS